MGELLTFSKFFVIICFMEANNNAVQNLASSLFRVMHLFRRGQGRGFREMNLDPSAVRILEFLAIVGAANPKIISQELDLLPSSITRHLQDLEGKGYVIVTSDPSDRRARRASLTEQGQAELQRLTRIGISMFSELLSDWQPEEIQQFTAFLDRLANRMSGPRLSAQELQRYLNQSQEQ